MSALDAALQDAIDAVFGDTSVPVERTIERLESARDDLDEKIRILRNQAGLG